MNSMHESDLPYLPNAIFLHHILPNLPVKSLLRFKSLNKQCCSTISDPDFKLSSRNRDRILLTRNVAYYSSEKVDYHVTMNNKGVIEKHEPPPTDEPMLMNQPNVLGSCNGLILMSVNKEIFLWNPSILGSYRKVLELGRLNRINCAFRSGFCYDRDEKDYIVVMKFMEVTDRIHQEVISASLKSKTWRGVSFPYHLRSVKVGPVVNNRLHWIVSGHKPSNDPDSGENLMSHRGRPRDTIIYYDCSSNGFKKFPVPDPIKEGGDDIAGLLELDECLCMVREVNDFDSMCDVEILVMKEYGVKESWTSTYVISDYKYQSIIAMRMDLEVANKHYDQLWFMIGWNFFSCEPSTKKLEWIGEPSTKKLQWFGDLKREDRNEFLSGLKPLRYVETAMPTNGYE